jgi:hypothetical protein
VYLPELCLDTALQSAGRSGSRQISYWQELIAWSELLTFDVASITPESNVINERSAGAKFTIIGNPPSNISH